MRPLSILPFAVAALLGGALRADAASHHEITIIPIGPAQVRNGTQEVSYKLALGPEGVLPQPTVFCAAQPWVAAAPPAPLLPDEQAAAGEEEKQQVPATLRFTVAGRKLPPWELQPHSTAYVINFDTVKANPEYGNGRLALKIDVNTTAAAVDLTSLGMPDVLLLDSSTNGPLTDLAQSATDPEVKAYLLALATDVTGDKRAAQKEYQKLRTAKNDRVCRFARRGLRMLSYDLRKRKLSGNFMEHYRWGLYLQQCGLFAAAFEEFEECRIIFPWHGDAQFRAGETLDRLGASVFKVLDYMDRTGEAAKITDPTDWYVLVVILKSRSGKTLTAEEIRQIKDNWLIVEEAVWATGGGRARIITSFFDVENDQQQSYAMREDGLYAPTDDIVEVRGWFDGVISVVPRLPSEADAPSHTVGGDAGPNGAAISCLFHDAPRHDYLAAWYEQLTWAARVGEVGCGIPFGDEAIGCGHRPAPHGGYAYRAALRYYLTPSVLRRLKITDVPVPDSCVQLWEIEGPQAVKDAPSSAGLPGHHVLDTFPTEPAPRTVRIVSDQDFIDLAKLFPDAGWSCARATSWVYSPKDQEVRMWLGQNDGMAVWVNGRCVHEGNYYSADHYEDEDLVDTIASYANLEEGWNEVCVVVESWPAPRDKGWGFSVRFCTWDNQPIPGIAYVNEQPDKDLVSRCASPKAGVYYSWEEVKHDYRDALPMLGAADWENVTGVKGLRITGGIDKYDGHIAIVAPGQSESRTYRALSGPWQCGKDRDVVLNNVLDWAREACAAFRYEKDGKVRDLLVLKPEAFEAYLTLLNEPASAVELFAERPPAERILGYVVVPAGPSTRTLLVVDTLLGDGDDAERPTWPVDEEDLLTPFGENIPNADFAQMGPQLPQPDSTQ